MSDLRIDSQPATGLPSDNGLDQLNAAAQKINGSQMDHVTVATTVIQPIQQVQPVEQQTQSIPKEDSGRLPKWLIYLFLIIACTIVLRTSLQLGWGIISAIATVLDVVLILSFIAKVVLPGLRSRVRG